jgi:hypothetical protein
VAADLCLRATAAAVALSAIFAPLAAAAPVCCRLFGIDATPMLGPDPVVCGKVVTGDRRIEAEEETQEDRRRATKCALEAQAQGRAFVYTYRLLVPPDIDVITQAVFGAQGERMLLKLGRFRGENIHTVETCETLSVLPDGKLKGAACFASY